MHHSTIYKENPTRCNNYQNFIILYLFEAQHVLGNTPPIIRSLKLHWQPLVFHTWKVVGRVAGGRCQAQADNVHQLHIQQPSFFFFFFLRRYNFREVLAFSTSFFHLIWFLMQSFQFVIFILFVALYIILPSIFRSS
jgi:hypothetical protein